MESLLFAGTFIFTIMSGNKKYYSGQITAKHKKHRGVRRGVNAIVNDTTRGL